MLTNFSARDELQGSSFQIFFNLFYFNSKVNNIHSINKNNQVQITKTVY